MAVISPYTNPMGIHINPTTKNERAIDAPVSEIHHCIITNQGPMTAAVAMANRYQLPSDF